MLERLLEFLLSAKSGVLAGVLLVGTTGALVTATVQNGVTTITITQASASPSASASASPLANTTPSASPSPHASPSSSPSSAAAALQAGTPNACADETHLLAGAVKKVDSTFAELHSDLSHRRESARTDSARQTLEAANKLLGQIREDAVKAIHATNTCAKTDDEDKNDVNDENKNDVNDEDQNENNDGGKTHSQQNFLVVLLGNIFGQNTTTVTTTASPTPSASASASPSVSTSVTTTTLTFTGTDPNAIADQAVAAMKLVHDDAVAQLPTPAAPAKVRPSHSPESHGRDSGHHESGHD